jgi:antitoxin component YwqK of YwqJK toxin-antitoxin module
MMKSCLPVIALLIAFSGVAQKDSIRKYLDQDLYLTSKSNAIYQAMAIRNGDQWMLAAVYPDTSLLLKMFFKDRALTIKDGPCILYYPKNKPWQKGLFSGNKAQGLWQSWYWNGQLKSEGSMVNNRLVGVWKTWYDSGQIASQRTYGAIDAITTPQKITLSYNEVKLGLLGDFYPTGVLQGAGTTWYRNGRKESEVNYQNDTLSGLCTWYRENGQPSSKETYVHGKVNELECFDENGTPTAATCSILKLPQLIHPFFSALDYIEYELHKEKNKDIKTEGEVIVQFTVTKEGTLEKLVIKSSPDEALSKHITRIFAAMPAWSPAVVHNRRIDYTTVLEIPYYRNLD